MCCRHHVFISQPLKRPVGAASPSTPTRRCPLSPIFPKGEAGCIFFLNRPWAPSPNQWRTTSLKHVSEFSSHIWSSWASCRQINHVEQPAGGIYRYLTSFNWGPLGWEGLRACITLRVWNDCKDRFLQVQLPIYSTSDFFFLWILCIRCQQKVISILETSRNLNRISQPHISLCLSRLVNKLPWYWCLLSFSQCFSFVSLHVRPTKVYK